MQQATRLIGLVFLLFVAAYVQAQRPGRVPIEATPGGIPGIPQQQEPFDSSRLEQITDDIPDTVGIFFIFADNPNRETPFSDSTLSDFQQYDPVRRRAFDHRHLGNLGSAHEPIVFETVWRRGFDIGLHQFDLYMTSATQVRYHRLQKAFTNVSFMVGSEQADTYTTAQFSRNFAKGLNFSLDYSRMSQLGRSNQYPNQNTRNTSFNTGFWMQGQGGRYQAFLAVASNSVEQEDNGGLAVEPNLEGQFASPSSAQVFLNNGQTRYSSAELAYTQYFQLGGKPDSLKGLTRAFTLSHQALLGNYRYKFFDDNVLADNAFFEWFPILGGDARGVRHFIQHRKIENSFRLSTFRLRAKSTSEAKSERDLLEVGLVHTLHLLGQEPRDSTLNNLFLTGRWNISFGERMRLETYGHLGLLDNAGDYRAEGKLFLDFGSIGQLRGEFINQLYAPTLMQHRFFVSQRPVWNNDFRKTLSTTLGGTYNLPRLQLALTGRYHLLNNFIYFDTTAVPQQTAAPISILQFLIQKDFRVWRLHLDNTLALQTASSEVVRLPRIFGKHSFYYEGFWFGVLDVKLGIDLRYNDTFAANYYNPVTGQFQLQNRRDAAFYPAVDAFFTMRVTKFRAFAKMENLTNALLTDRFFYQTAFYAHPPSAFRFGIKWRLVD